MSDKALLKMAALAAGNGAVWRNGDPFALHAMTLPRGCGWNPLDSDGDAFRLLVQLGLPINPEFGKGGLSVSYAPAHVHYIEKWSRDPAAARRAVVEAAAMSKGWHYD